MYIDVPVIMAEDLNNPNVGSVDFCLCAKLPTCQAVFSTSALDERSQKRIIFRRCCVEKRTFHVKHADVVDAVNRINSYAVSSSL